MIKIFVEQISERLIYTLDFVFKERGLEYSLTNDQLYFFEYQGPKFNYSVLELQGVVGFVPASILFDEDIREYTITAEKFRKGECLCFDGIDDPLASIFYVLTRYEEYLSAREDQHGRFEAKYSILSRFNWLEKVVCDRWAVGFLEILTDQGILQETTLTTPVKICPTFDIDNAYAYQLKEGVRQWMSSFRDYLKRDKLRINERRQVLLGARKDPYDTYDYISSIAERGFQLNIFWLVGDYKKFDRNVSYRDVRHQRLIRKMDRVATVGIHPSYRSNDYEFYFLSEIERLGSILNRKVEHSRQHFLKLRIQDTYQRLISAGVKHDYTMGFADNVGFRSGTARPHRWFDLTRNNITGLIIHPFAYMDGTLNEYLNLDIEAAKIKIKELYLEVSTYGGDFSFIWHNETIGNYGKWEGWSEVLEFTLNLKENNE